MGLGSVCQLPLPPPVLCNLHDSLTWLVSYVNAIIAMKHYNPSRSLANFQNAKWILFLINRVPPCSLKRLYTLTYMKTTVKCCSCTKVLYRISTDYTLPTLHYHTRTCILTIYSSLSSWLCSSRTCGHSLSGSPVLHRIGKSPLFFPNVNKVPAFKSTITVSIIDYTTLHPIL